METAGILEEEILLDENVVAAQHEFYIVGSLKVTGNAIMDARHTSFEMKAWEWIVMHDFQT